MRTRSFLLNSVLGIQRLDYTGACTLFLLLHSPHDRLSAEETLSTRLTHNLCCNWTDVLAVCFDTRGHSSTADFAELQRLIQNGAVPILNSTFSHH
jgi:hypothetical protein